MKIKTILIICLISTPFLSQSQEIKATFSKEVITKLELNYILQLPDSQKDKFPLLVFLHGSGERDSDLESVKNHSPFTYQNLIKKPLALLAPHCPKGIQWDTTALYKLIIDISSKYNIDKSRIYLTGLSMGGWGTWKLAEEHPELFAAIAPVCGPVDDYMLEDAVKLKDLPIRIYHGALDDLVSPTYAITMHQELKKVNANAQIFIFSNDNHNSWDSTYSDPKFYEWILAQHK
ncbi:prolyl oligopeptidase family serine peptidase [Flavobacterium sp. AS60]|uniref:carboxylesterase family protein n=1 Tax=Flavobacterium anseongense TaxID=2910677 RepID=UPI001F230C29|nr:prolyl oligopeptidase family serine peptidase [Flavobacterium sp. AS60]MCF6128828.1 prolyl oligopeptidase family serine peptidase [Flavobacterium sp. AS60]